MLSCLCSLSHFILTPRCVCGSLCVCVLDRLLWPPPPLAPRGCAVLCSGSNDGFCASQYPSQQDTHIKGSFSGQPCARVYVLFFAIMCVCVCVHMCATLCDSKNIIFGGACWLCLILSACPTHQGSHWNARSLSLLLSLSLSPLLPPLPFSIYLSVPLFLLPVWHFCCPQTTSLHFPSAYQLLDFTRGASPFSYCKSKQPHFRKQRFLLEKLWVPHIPMCNKWKLG